MELNARTAPDGFSLDAEICIVGAGPAGLSLAHALESRGIRSVLLESAGSAQDPRIQDLNAGLQSAELGPDLRLSRHRSIGGTAAIWNTMLQGAPFAKYAPLDACDFLARDWLPHSGWPLSRGELESYYRQAQRVAGLGPFDYRAAAWTDAAAPLLPCEGTSLLQSVHQYGSAERFRATLPAAMIASPNSHLVHGATVTRLERSGERISEAAWRTLDGRKGTCRADCFVLAAGAIENARFLLGIVPDSEWLGRGFMEHPVDNSMQLLSRADTFVADPGFWTPHDTGRGVVAGRIGLSPELLEAERLGNASLRFIREVEPEVLRRTGWRELGRRVVPWQRLRRLLGGSLRRAHRATAAVRPASYRVLLDLEQPPHRDNTIRLTSRRDPFGVPRAELSWSWRPEDEARRQRTRAVFVRELERAGVGKLVPVTRAEFEPGAHHHAGTARMHPDPSEGVVDSELRVHGMENLFVAGAAVFPTAGVANPTLTVIALSLRLADRLAPPR